MGYFLVLLRARLARRVRVLASVSGFFWTQLRDVAQSMANVFDGQQALDLSVLLDFVEFDTPYRLLFNCDTPSEIESEMSLH
jgi:hypothetical protein